MTKIDLTLAERRALLRVRKAHGIRWRAALRKAWEDGTLARLVGMSGPVDVLQGLRTKLGTSCLAKVRLDEDC